MISTTQQYEMVGQRIPDCEFCGHDWHGTDCLSVTGPREAHPDPMWPSLRGHTCECPSSYVEPPC